MHLATSVQNLGLSLLRSALDRLLLPLLLSAVAVDSIFQDNLGMERISSRHKAVCSVVESSLGAIQFILILHTDFSFRMAAGGVIDSLIFSGFANRFMRS